jgi:hypothetical protein
MMGRETEYVNYFYGKYHGRVAIGVGYNQDLSEIFPFVFQNANGDSIGIVALGVLPEENKLVYIYHLGAFISKHGSGSIILKELCQQADRVGIRLSVSAINLANGKDPRMKAERLKKWYKSFGFKGDSGLIRNPKPIDNE